MLSTTKDFSIIIITATKIRIFVTNFYAGLIRFQRLSRLLVVIIQTVSPQAVA